MARTDNALVLFPYKWKYAGIVLFGISLIMTVWYLIGDAQLELPVFAVVSAFFQTKWFVVYKTNIFDELIMLSALGGCFLMVFSRERTELPSFNLLRLRCWFDAVKYNALFMLLAIVFVYGTGFIVVLVVNMVLCMLLYLILFAFRKRCLTESG